MNNWRKYNVRYSAYKNGEKVIVEEVIESSTGVKDARFLESIIERDTDYTNVYIYSITGIDNGNE